MEPCGRFAERAKITVPRGESSTSSSTAPFLAVRIERDDLKKRCRGLALQNQCILGIAAEAKELRKKLADREKPNATAKTTLKGRERKRAIAANIRVVTHETELAERKLHIRD